MGEAHDRTRGCAPNPQVLRTDARGSGRTHRSCQTLPHVGTQRAQAGTGAEAEQSLTRNCAMRPNVERLVRQPHIWLIGFIGLIVPRRLRADWRQGWGSEVQNRETMLSEWDKLDWRHKLDLVRRSTSAFRDALWLQPRRWEDEMIQDLR